jgi:hypothetical protein
MIKVLQSPFISLCTNKSISVWEYNLCTTLTVFHLLCVSIIFGPHHPPRHSPLTSDATWAKIFLHCPLLDALEAPFDCAFTAYAIGQLRKSLSIECDPASSSSSVSRPFDSLNPAHRNRNHGNDNNVDANADDGDIDADDADGDADPDAVFHRRTSLSVQLLSRAVFIAPARAAAATQVSSEDEAESLAQINS